MRWDNPNRKIKVDYIVGKTFGAIGKVLKLRHKITGYILNSNIKASKSSQFNLFSHKNEKQIQSAHETLQQEQKRLHGSSQI